MNGSVVAHTSQTPIASPIGGARLARAAAPFVIAAVVLVIPTPEGLSIEAWRFLALFLATIVGVIVEPIPAAAVGLAGVFVGAALQLVRPTPAASAAWALSGFSHPTVWLVFAACIFTNGYAKTGLGKRIALHLTRLMGHKTLGLGYAVMLSDVVLAPVTPSATGRSGCTIYPVVRHIPELYGSRPDLGTERKLGASDEATMFGAGRGSAAAALANGVSSHILEFDDIHKGSTIHAGAPVIPAALAVAEREHADGRAFLTAVAVGYEAAFRIGEAVNPSHYYFWHPTGTVATFGSAAAAGSILRLSASEMVDALGTAGTQAAGLWEFNADGAMSKHLHPGKAAFNGVLSADLARAGFTGAHRILEGERGFFRAMSTDHAPTRVTDGLGSRWKIGENGYKLHACCAHTHTAIDVALDLIAERGWSSETALRSIAKIQIGTYGPGFEIVKEMNPRTPYQAKFSLAYCVAAALVDGRVGLDQFAADRFGPEGVQHTQIRTLLPHIYIEVADDLTRAYPAAWPTRVTLTLADGSTMRGASSYPRGNAENPVSTAELEAKFVTLVASGLGHDVAQAALGAVQTLEDAPDMSAVFRTLMQPRPAALSVNW